MLVTWQYKIHTEIHTAKQEQVGEVSLDVSLSLPPISPSLGPRPNTQWKESGDTSSNHWA